MIVDGNWVDDEEWLTEQLTKMHNAYKEIRAAIESGAVDPIDGGYAQKYMDHYISYKTPEEFWASSSSIC